MKENGNKLRDTCIHHQQQYKIYIIYCKSNKQKKTKKNRDCFTYVTMVIVKKKKQKK